MRVPINPKAKLLRLTGVIQPSQNAAQTTLDFAAAAPAIALARQDQSQVKMGRIISRRFGHSTLQGANDQQVEVFAEFIRNHKIILRRAADSRRCPFKSKA